MGRQTNTPYSFLTLPRQKFKLLIGVYFQIFSNVFITLLIYGCERIKKSIEGYIDDS